MQKIKLTKGFEAIVDDDDFYKLSKYKWHAVGGRYAARRKTISKGVHKMVYMHREILNPRGGFITDHKNGNRFDNRKENLRECTKSENSMGFQSKKTGTSSKYIGVAWDKEKRKWEAYMKGDYKRIHIGYFKDEIDAAKARDKAVLIRNKEFFHLNITPIPSQ